MLYVIAIYKSICVIIIHVMWFVCCVPQASQRADPQGDGCRSEGDNDRGKGGNEGEEQPISPQQSLLAQVHVDIYMSCTTVIYNFFL